MIKKIFKILPGYNKIQNKNKQNKDLISKQIHKTQMFKNFMIYQEMIILNIKIFFKKFKKLIMQCNLNKIFWIYGYYNNQLKMNNISINNLKFYLKKMEILKV